MIGLLQCRPGRHGKLLSSAHDVDQNRPLVRKRRLDSALQLQRLFNPDAANTHGFRHQRKVGVLEITTRVQKSIRLHFHFNKSERSIVEDNDLHRKPHLGQRNEVSHHHAETAVA